MARTAQQIKTYNVWNHMRHRCQNPKDKSFPRYGGRGIAVCQRWFIFSNFVADMGLAPAGLSLERSDNSLGYSADNCVWATATQQARNRRSTRLVEFNGVIKSMASWAEELHIELSLLHWRLNNWSVERALTEPVALGGGLFVLGHAPVTFRETAAE